MISATGVTLRLARPDDAEIIATFNERMAEETEDRRLDAATIRAGVRRVLGDPRTGRYYIAECDGRVVGQTMITLEWSDWRNGFFWWIQSVYVEPASRNRGVFRALYQHIRDEGRSTRDCCGLRLYVVAHNHKAMETYRRLGMHVSDYRICEEEWRRE